MSYWNHKHALRKSVVTCCNLVLWNWLTIYEKKKKLGPHTSREVMKGSTQHWRQVKKHHVILKPYTCIKKRSVASSCNLVPCNWHTIHKKLIMVEYTTWEPNIVKNSWLESINKFFFRAVVYWESGEQILTIRFYTNY